MYKDLQVAIPVFVTRAGAPIRYNGQTYKQDQHFPWMELNVPYETMRMWFQLGMVSHNEELEKQTKVGDRLSELDGKGLEKLVDALNAEVKKRTNSTKEFTDKRCKKSRIDEKQRGLIRSFLRNNRWIEETFFEARDRILDE